MKRLFIVILFLTASILYGNSQELRCQVSVQSTKIKGANKNLFTLKLLYQPSSKDFGGTEMEKMNLKVLFSIFIIFIMFFAPLTFEIYPDNSAYAMAGSGGGKKGKNHA